MEIGERLRKAIERVGLTQREIARRSGLDVATVSELVSGKTQRPAFDTVQRIIRATGLSFAAVFDEPRIQLSAEDADVASRFHKVLGRLLENDLLQKDVTQRDRSLTTPARHREPAGGIIRDAAPRPEIVSEVENVPDAIIPGQYLRLGARRAFRVVSDVMIGVGILEGALVYVRPTVDLSSADGQLIVCRLNQALFLKRLDLRGAQISLHSENPRYAPIAVSKSVDDFSIIGIVVFENQDVPATLNP